MKETVHDTLGLVEALACYPGGAPLGRLSESLGLAAAEVESMLAELVRCGYACRVRGAGNYALTTKMSCLGLAFLSRSRVVDVAQPVLDRLCEKIGELAWLSIVDGDRLPWIVRGGDAHSGMRYDYAIGTDAPLCSTATGYALLSTLPDDEAEARLQAQGLGQPGQYGPNAPKTIAEVMDAVRQARPRGYAIAMETFTTGLNSVAAPVRGANEPAIGAISIGGPAERMSEARLHELAPPLLEAAAELAAARGGSQLLLRIAASGHKADAPA